MDPGSRNERPRRLHTIRIDASVRQMERNLDQVRRTECLAEQQFSDWQSRWIARHTAIVQQLDEIHHQLATLGEQNTGRPQLSIVSDLL
jgi:uncharacterized protein YukE